MQKLEKEQKLVKENLEKEQKERDAAFATLQASTSRKNDATALHTKHKKKTLDPRWNETFALPARSRAVVPRSREPQTKRSSRYSRWRRRTRTRCSTCCARTTTT